MRVCGWEDFELPLGMRMWLRKTRLFWRGRFGLKWFLAWTTALVVYLAIGLQPVEAKNYQIIGQVSIPAISLTSEVAKLEAENGGLTTPDAIVGSFSNRKNKTLLIGHSTGVFAGLEELKIGDEISYDNKTYRITDIATVAKEEIDMKELLEYEKTDTIVLMTCAGMLYSNGDASERLIITAVNSL